MNKLIAILLCQILFLACSQENFISGIYSVEAGHDGQEKLPSVDLNVTGDQIVTGSGSHCKIQKLER